MGLFPAIICIVKEHGEAGLKTVPLFHAQFLERNDAMEEQINDELYGRMKDCIFQQAIQFHEQDFNGVDLNVGEILVGPKEILEEGYMLGEPGHSLESVRSSCVYLPGAIRPGFWFQRVDGVLPGHKVDITAA